MIKNYEEIKNASLEWGRSLRLNQRFVEFYCIEIYEDGRIHPRLLYCGNKIDVPQEAFSHLI